MEDKQLINNFMEGTDAKIAVLENRADGQDKATETLKVDIMDRIDRGFNDMSEKIDHMIESQNGKNRMLDDRITKEAERISELEQKFYETKEAFMKELATMRTKQEVSGVKLGALIIILSSATTIVASSLVSALVDIVK